MANSSKFKLTNDRFEQQSGDTLTLSGNTIINGNLEFSSGYTPTGNTSVATKLYTDQNGINNLTFENGITRSGNTISLGGLIDDDTVLSISSDFSFDFLSTQYTDRSVTSGSTIQSFGGSGAVIFDTSSIDTFESVVAYYNFGLFEPFLLLRDGNNAEFLFEKGSNPASWSGATITDDPNIYLIQTVVDNYGIAYVREINFNDGFSDILLFDTQNKVVRRLSDNIPALGSLYSDVSIQLNIWKYVSVQGLNNGSGDYLACLFDNTSSGTTYVYNSSSDLLRTYQAGDTVSGDTSTVPTHISASVPTTTTAQDFTTVILETENTNVDGRYIQIDSLDNTTTNINLPISQGDFNIYLDKLTGGTLVYNGLSSIAQQPPSIEYTFLYVFTDEVIEFTTKSNNSTLYLGSDSVVLNDVDTRAFNIYNNGTIFNKSHLYITWNSTQDFYIKPYNTETNDLYEFRILISGGLSFTSNLIYNLPNNIFLDENFPIFNGNSFALLTYTSSIIYATANEIKFVNSNNQSFVIEKDVLNGNGFNYPSGYTPTQGTNLTTLGYISGITVNEYTSYSANTENIAGADAFNDLRLTVTGLTAQTNVDNITFENGISRTSDTVSLGGTLTGDTIIDTTFNHNIGIGYNTTFSGGTYGSFAVGHSNTSCAPLGRTFVGGLGNTVSGSYSSALGFYNVASGYQSFASGYKTSATTDASFSIGNRTCSNNTSTFAGGKGEINLPILAAGNTSFNFSINTGAQTIGYGALADESVILGGIDHNIASGNTRAAIIGGNTIKLTGTTYIDTTAVGNLAIIDTPTTGVSGDTVLVRDSSTGIIRQIAQSGLTSGGGVNDFKSTIVGDDTTTAFVINHALGSRDVLIQVFENQSPYDQPIIDIERTDLNNITVNFDIAPATGVNYRVLILGI